MIAEVYIEFMNRDYQKYLGSLLLFGSNGIVASAIDLPSAEIVVLRSSLGAALLCALLLVGRKGLTLHKSPRDLLLVAGSGAALGVCWVFVYMAYREVGVGITSLLYALGPVLVMAASPLLFGERLTLPACACFGVVVFGALLANGPVAAGANGMRGIAHGLAAAVAYAMMIVLCKKARTGSGLECSAVQLVSASAASIVAVAVQGIELVPISVASIAPALMLGLVNTGIGCYLYFSAITRLPAQTVAACDYVEPLTAVLLSAAMLGESMAPSQLLGAALVIAGAVSCEFVRRGRQTADGEERVSRDRALPTPAPSI